MSNFWQRSLTGLIFVVVLISAIYFGPWSSILLFGLFTLIGLYEFTNIIGSSKKAPLVAGVAVLNGFSIYTGVILVSLNKIEPALLFGFALLVALQLFAEMVNSKPDYNRFLTHIAGSTLVALPFALLTTFGHVFEAFEPLLLIGLFILLWTSDTGAYLVGKSIGKHKLIAKISPGKTIEGFVGGLVLSGVVGYILSLSWDFLSQTDWIVLGIIMAVFGALGDLSESMFKRSYGVKDSGTILPGHGGVLDRFDGLIIAVPVALFYLMLRY
jgi:phosphatidate cytidylyltransferase